MMHACAHTSAWARIKSPPSYHFDENPSSSCVPVTACFERVIVAATTSAEKRGAKTVLWWPRRTDGCALHRHARRLILGFSYSGLGPEDLKMLSKCLVCGHTSAPSALLCESCGAPLPEHAPNTEPKMDGTTQKHQGAPIPSAPKRSRALPVILAGLVAISLVGLIVTMTRSEQLTPKSTLETMPNGMNALSAWNIGQLWNYEKLRPIWNNPLVQQYFSEAKSLAGIDVNALETLIAGSRLQDGKPEILYVLRGAFDASLFDPLIRSICNSEVLVAGRQLCACDMDALMPGPTQQHLDHVDENEPVATEGDTNDGDAPVASIAPIKEPKAADTAATPLSLGVVAVGVWDETTLVAGSPTLLEAYLSGGGAVGQNDSLAQHLVDVDKDAFGWGAVTLGAVVEQVKSLLPALDNVPQLARAALTFEVQLKELIGLNLTLDLDDEDAVKAIKPLVQLAVATALQAANENLAIAGQAGLLTADVQGAGSKLKLTLTMKIPSLPSL